MCTVSPTSPYPNVTYKNRLRVLLLYARASIYCFPYPTPQHSLYLIPPVPTASRLPVSLSPPSHPPYTHLRNYSLVPSRAPPPYLPRINRVLTSLLWQRAQGRGCWPRSPIPSLWGGRITYISYKGAPSPCCLEDG